LCISCASDKSAYDVESPHRGGFSSADFVGPGEAQARERGGEFTQILCASRVCVSEVALPQSFEQVPATVLVTGESDTVDPGTISLPR
jgi:hypothetical protein